MQSNASAGVDDPFFAVRGRGISHGRSGSRFTLGSLAVSTGTAAASAAAVATAVAAFASAEQLLQQPATAAFVAWIAARRSLTASGFRLTASRFAALRLAATAIKQTTQPRKQINPLSAALVARIATSGFRFAASLFAASRLTASRLNIATLPLAATVPNAQHSVQ